MISVALSSAAQSLDVVPAGSTLLASPEGDAAIVNVISCTCASPNPNQSTVNVSCSSNDGAAEQSALGDLLLPVGGA